MSRGRYLAIAVMTMAAALTARSEEASDHACTRDALPRISAPARLAEMFAGRDASVQTPDGVISRDGATEVVMARIGADGKPVMACVDNEQAARRFLALPVTVLRHSAAQDQ
jgi:hypothetical protein